MTATDAEIAKQAREVARLEVERVEAEHESQRAWTAHRDAAARLSKMVAPK